MPIAFQIRPAQESDRDTLRRMVMRERLDPTSIKWERFLVAEYENTIIAIGQIKQLSGCQELGSLVTLPQYRGQGVAGAIIQALEARAERPLYLLCRSTMVSFYKRFGYEVIKRGDAPMALRIKSLPMLIAPLFGIHGAIMRKK